MSKYLSMNFYRKFYFDVIKIACTISLTLLSFSLFSLPPRKKGIEKREKGQSCRNIININLNDSYI